jgi:lipoprotein NlpD
MAKVFPPGASVSSARIFTLVSMSALMAACGVTQPHRAPVEDRAPASVEQMPVTAPESKPSSPPAEVAKSQQYAVRPGDTLIRIALDHGIGWRDLARWNGLDNPNLIEVGQVLRVAPPTSGEATRPVSVARVESKPLDSKTLPATASSGSVAATPSNGASVPTAQPVAVAGGDAELSWAWPSSGALMTPFDEQRNKGLALAGKPGDAVLAAADGRVMYAGSGLRGYGNMVIIKHNDTYLSAYAHNQTLLVKEDQVVKKGQPIAEMGSSDADQVKLHFEIRRKGKPVDPARLLPSR